MPPRKRQPRRREVMRSFRIPIALDRQLATAARKRGFSRSLLLRDIVTGWLTFENVPKSAERLAEREIEEIASGEG